MRTYDDLQLATFTAAIAVQWEDTAINIYARKTNAIMNQHACMAN